MKLIFTTNDGNRDRLLSDFKLIKKSLLFPALIVRKSKIVYFTNLYSTFITKVSG